MQKSPEAEPIMTPLCKGGSKTPAFEPHVTPGFARLNPGILRKGQLNRHTRYRPATTTVPHETLPRSGRVRVGGQGRQVF